MPSKLGSAMFCQLYGEHAGTMMFGLRFWKPCRADIQKHPATPNPHSRAGAEDLLAEGLHSACPKGPGDAGEPQPGFGSAALATHRCTQRLPVRASGYGSGRGQRQGRRSVAWLSLCVAYSAWAVQHNSLGFACCCFFLFLRIGSLA